MFSVCIIAKIKWRRSTEEAVIILKSSKSCFLSTVRTQHYVTSTCVLELVIHKAQLPYIKVLGQKVTLGD